MAVIIIQENGACIRIVIDGKPRNIQKTAIKEIDVIKNTIVKLDIGEGALHNVFINHPEVTEPATADAAALREALIAMLPTIASGAGSATEAKQDQAIAILNNMNTALVGIEDRTFDEPLLTDHSGAGIIYKGYAFPGSLPTQPKWAIQRIRHEADVDVITWSGGVKTLDKIWDDREVLIYS